MSVTFFAMKDDTILPDSFAEAFQCSNSNASRFLCFLGLDTVDLCGTLPIEDAWTLVDKAEASPSKAYDLRLDRYVQYFAELVEQAADSGATTINYG